MTTLKELLTLGFTPAAAIAIVGLIFVWARYELGTRNQNRTREAWHSETRSRIDDMQVHIEACNEDRETLKEETSLLKVEVAKLSTRISSCPRINCPMK